MHQGEGEPSATQPVLSLYGFVCVHQLIKLWKRGILGRKYCRESVTSKNTRGSVV